MTFIPVVQGAMRFGKQPQCQNCKHSVQTSEEKGVPPTRICTYLKEAYFAVEESDTCQKWSER